MGYRIEDRTAASLWLEEVLTDPAELTRFVAAIV
jgi:hypothetical protein